MSEVVLALIDPSRFTKTCQGADNCVLQDAPGSNSKKTTASSDSPGYHVAEKLESKLQISPSITSIILPYITRFKEFRL